jgi:hypothetical protein
MLHSIQYLPNLQAVTTLIGLTTLTMPVVRVVVHARLKVTIRTAQKSPSLTVREIWLSTRVSTVGPTASRTICFR